MNDENRSNTEAAKAQIELSRDVFMRGLIRELSGSLEDVIGLKGAAGYISLVGQNMGEKINSEYRSALSVERLDRTQVCDVLVDLKRRIQGKFYIIEENEDRIVLGNHACPFGDKVIGRPSMCMMTSNVFGHIASQNLGYAKVELQETIAKGDPGCRVVIYLKQTKESDAAAGREYVEI
ncbi:MAG: transcriptional regulator [Nitrosomonas sp.]|nr:transcriptional regulator [Nitrosomonas sp.]